MKLFNKMDTYLHWINEMSENYSNFRWIEYSRQLITQRFSRSGRHRNENIRFSFERLTVWTIKIKLFEHLLSKIVLIESSCNPFLKVEWRKWYFNFRCIVFESMSKKKQKFFRKSTVFRNQSKTRPTLLTRRYFRLVSNDEIASVERKHNTRCHVKTKRWSRRSTDQYNHEHPPMFMRI